MGARSWKRYGATTAAAAVVTTVMAAAACTSSGEIGVGANADQNVDRNVDLNTVTAAQAVKDAGQAAAAQHTVRIHTVTTAKDYVTTVDGLQRTDRFAEDLTAVSKHQGVQAAAQAETRGDGSTLYVDEPGLPAAERGGRTWVKLDLDHLPPPTSTTPGASMFADLGAAYQHDDPGQSALFPLACPDLHKVGVETKDGRPAVHVAGTATPAALAVPAPTRR